ncbi:MAG: tail fiber domain-containing protein, partial [Elusimicrobiota bacterium]
GHLGMMLEGGDGAGGVEQRWDIRVNKVNDNLEFVDNSYSNLVCMTISNISGCVGIGTTIPRGLLQVGSLTVPSDGNVGIGTTEPGAKLDISHIGESIRLSGSTAQSYMTFYTTTTRQGYIGTGGSGNDVVFSSDFNLQLQAGASSSKNLILKSDGSVGIGTNNPSHLLDIVGPNANIGLHATSGGNDWYIFSRASGDSNPGGLDFGKSGSNPYLAINSSGWVGIGTNIPVSPLTVAGYTNYSAWYGDYLMQDGIHNITPQSWSTNISIRCAAGVFAEGFYTNSDRRIKNLLGTSKNDLELINRLKVVDYKYIDEVGKGNKPKKGFIAQEVEEVFPQAVSTSVDYVPNIYAGSEEIKYNKKKKELTVKLNKEHDFKEGDEVRIITKSGLKEEAVVKIKDDVTFVVGNFTEEDLEGDDKVFVYGRKADDFKILDYDEIYAVGIGAIQELSKGLDEKSKEIMELKEEKNKEIKYLITENQELKKRIVILEEKIK